MNIQWFPGHMAKAKRMIAEEIKNVDAVIDIRDSRCPIASSNDDIGPIIGAKPRLIVMNKTDLADPAATRKWSGFFTAQNFGVFECDAKSGRGIEKFQTAIKNLLSEKIERDRERGINRTIRVMVIGIPNVGKSTFINKLAGKRAAVTADRPGVTRSKQWIKAGNGIELLDTPGILPPKLSAGVTLAYTGAIRDEIISIEELGFSLMNLLLEYYPELIESRYSIDINSARQSENPLSELAKKRGFLISGGEADIRRAAIILLDEFRAGKLGRITLESPPLS